MPTGRRPGTNHVFLHRDTARVLDPCQWCSSAALAAIKCFSPTHAQGTRLLMEEGLHQMLALFQDLLLKVSAAPYIASLLPSKAAADQANTSAIPA